MISTKKRRRTLQRQNNFEGWYWGLLLISPWLIGFLWFKLIPIVSTLWLALTDMELLDAQNYQFIGLKNFLFYIGDRDTYLVLWETIKISLLIIPLQTIGSIVIAAMLSNKMLKLKNTARALFFLPSIIPGTAYFFVWEGFVNTRTGWLNRLILDPLGLEQLNIFAGRGSGPALFILGTLWMLGPGMLIIMGAMQGIPSDILEAATVDGASRVRRFFSITLPLISPAIFFTLILNLTAAFGGARLMDRGYSFSSQLSSFDSYIYFTLFRRFEIGAAASLAWLFFIFVIALVLFLFWSSKKWVYFPAQED